MLDVVPGDMIEWMYESTNDDPDKGTFLRSTLTNTWCPVSGRALLVTIDDEKYSCLTEHGTFSACFDDDTISLKRGRQQIMFTSRLSLRKVS